VVATLLAFGAFPDAANSGGQRAVHYAASKGHLDVLKKLKESGAACDVSDHTGSTPCHRAASTGKCAVLEFLVSNCAIDVECRNKVGQTPLIVACEAGFDEAVLKLARLGADIEATDAEKNGARSLAPKLVPALRSIKQGDM
jgi:26S proteasome non-ATPase regulatory subunit 10